MNKTYIDKNIGIRITERYDKNDYLIDYIFSLGDGKDFVSVRLLPWEYEDNSIYYQKIGLLERKYEEKKEELLKEQQRIDELNRLERERQRKLREREPEQLDFFKDFSILNWYKKAMAITEVYDYSRLKEQLLDSISNYINENKYFKENDIYDLYRWIEEFDFTEIKSKFDYEMFLGRIRDNGDYHLENKFRNIFTNFFSWSIPTKEALDAIKEFVSGEPIIEFMGGSGYWAYLLKKNGEDIISSDIRFNPDKNTYIYSKDPRKNWIQMQEKDIADILPQDVSGKVVMLSWIPYGEGPVHILDSMSPGSKLILIGENRGGCTSNDDFFDKLEENFEYIDKIENVRFDRIYDSITFYVKKGLHKFFIMETK